MGNLYSFSKKHSVSFKKKTPKNPSARQSWSRKQNQGQVTLRVWGHIKGVCFYSKQSSAPWFHYRFDHKIQLPVLKSEEKKGVYFRWLKKRVFTQSKIYKHCFRVLFLLYYLDYHLLFRLIFF